MFEFSLIYGFDFICKMIGREKPKYFEYMWCLKANWCKANNRNTVELPLAFMHKKRHLSIDKCLSNIEL
jgi:hypothetical protein